MNNTKFIRGDKIVFGLTEGGGRPGEFIRYNVINGDLCYIRLETVRKDELDSLPGIVLTGNNELVVHVNSVKHNGAPRFKDDNPNKRFKDDNPNKTFKRGM